MLNARLLHPLVGRPGLPRASSLNALENDLWITLTDPLEQGVAAVELRRNANRPTCMLDDQLTPLEER